MADRADPVSGGTTGFAGSSSRVTIGAGAPDGSVPVPGRVPTAIARTPAVMSARKNTPGGKPRALFETAKARLTGKRIADKTEELKGMAEEAVGIEESG